MNYKTPQKAAHVGLKLEDIRPLSTYAFTYNPEVQLMESVDRLLKVTDLVKSTLESEYAEYVLYTELSQFGRIHFHGYITIIDPFKFLLLEIDKLKCNGSFVIKLIDNDEIWFDYCTKQCHILKVKALFIPKYVLLRNTPFNEIRLNAWQSQKQQFKDSIYL